MAIKLENKTNVLAPNATYEFGNITDSTTGSPGTPVSVKTYADFHQFFAKLMDDAGVVYNGNPDNTSNGYQLFEALNTWYNNKFKSYEYTFAQFFNELTNISGFVYVYSATTQGLTEITDDNDSGTTDLCSLGRIIQVGTKHRMRFRVNPIGSFNFRIIINSTNLVSNPPIIKTGVAANDSVYNPTPGQVITFFRTFEGWELIEE